MKLKRFLALAVATCVVFSLPSIPVSAKTVTDAHGNQVELDETVSAYSAVLLSGSDEAARKGETNLGDLWTDALLWFAESGEINAYFDEDDIAAGNKGISEKASGVVALWNGGNLKSDIKEGTFGSEEIMQVLPYPNKVAVVYMTGAQLTEALEAASQGLPYTEETAAACASFMQVAGLEYKIDLNKAYDKGEAYGNNWYTAKSLGRVTITSVNGKAYDAKALYAVITSNANFNGMDSGYIFKQAASENEISTITTAVVRDVVWMYIEKKLENVVSEAYAESQGRITVLSEEIKAENKQNVDKKNDVKKEDAKQTVYTVKKGDTLYKIAKAQYGKGKYWPLIYKANEGKIKNPNLIFPGQKFVIPEIDN